jgi:hypothetical protein
MKIKDLYLGFLTGPGLLADFYPDFGFAEAPAASGYTDVNRSMIWCFVIFFIPRNRHP